VEAAIVGEHFRLSVVVDRYEFPNLHDYDDANWVVARVAAELRGASPFEGSMSVTLRTEELADFAHELRTMVDAGSGTATLDHMEEEVHVKIELTKRKGYIEGYIGGYLNQHASVELRFEGITTDQTLLRPAVAEFDAIADAFPVRGSRA
jgi:hypothetical protein